MFAKGEETVHAGFAVPVMAKIAVDREQTGDDVAAGTVVPHLLAVPQSLLPEYDEHEDE